MEAATVDEASFSRWFVEDLVAGTGPSPTMRRQAATQLAIRQALTSSPETPISELELSEAIDELIRDGICQSDHGRIRFSHGLCTAVSSGQTPRKPPSQLRAWRFSSTRPVLRLGTGPCGCTSSAWGIDQTPSHGARPLTNLTQPVPKLSRTLPWRHCCSRTTRQGSS